MANLILSDFQKKAISNIDIDNHVLITAHTGSGKTLPAEYAIKHNISKNKKIIYTCPIKALSNQKFKDFSDKYIDIEVGLLTGDIKHNPNASLIVMTTEILHNKLLRMMNKEQKQENYYDFDMDIEKELGCVIFDEVHYINDHDRGYIWENTIMMLPDNVQLIMLSATISNPIKIACWIENIKNKKVSICSTDKRVVPLKYYSYYTSINTKKIIDKTNLKLINDTSDKLHLIKENENIYLNKICDINKCKKIETNSPTNIHVINKLCEHLRDKDMFPALFFIFSRKLVESMAKSVNISLYNENEKDFMVEPFFRQLLVKKVVNWKEYMELPEYTFYIKLLEKGIGLHHAGMLPIFREMMEILYENRYIKVMFSTETFAIGLNMPTKTVCFTNLYKHDNKNKRLLFPHEFTQMSGRAGRRNIDTVGNVILLDNLYDLSENDYFTLLNSKSNNITSKYIISPKLILTYLKNNLSKHDVIKYIEKSLLFKEIKYDIDNIDERIIKLINDKNNIQIDEVKVTNINKYYILVDELDKIKGNKRKKIAKEVNNLHKNIEKEDLVKYNDIKKINENIKEEVEFKNYSMNYIENKVNNVLDIINFYNIIDENKITDKGEIFLSINEVNPFIFSSLYDYTDGFKMYDDISLFSLLSLFCETKNNDKSENFHTDLFSDEIKFINGEIEKAKKYDIVEYNFRCNTDIYKYIYDWMDKCKDELSCLTMIEKIKETVSVGDFIKCCLKIIHISNELSSICNVELLEKINTGKHKLKKFIVTNNSLYL